MWWTPLLSQGWLFVLSVSVSVHFWVNQWSSGTKASASRSTGHCLRGPWGHDDATCMSCRVRKLREHSKGSKLTTERLGEYQSWLSTLRSSPLDFRTSVLGHALCSVLHATKVTRTYECELDYLPTSRTSHTLPHFWAESFLDKNEIWHPLSSTRKLATFEWSACHSKSTHDKLSARPLELQQLLSVLK